MPPQDLKRKKKNTGLQGKATINNDPKSQKETTLDFYLRRKIFFIHGTNSDKNRWSKFPKAVKALSCIALDLKPGSTNLPAIQQYIDTSFGWKGLSGTFNDVLDRRKAAENLKTYILSNTKNIDEIILIGHSHGGNVAIQAVDMLSGSFTNIYVITVATPVYNSLEITSMKNFSNLPLIGKENGYSKKLRYSVIYYKYTNVENPVNWKAKASHIALWNKHDFVDGIASVYNDNADYLDGFEAMKETSNYFTYNAGVNVALHVDVDKILKNKIKEITPLIEKTKARLNHVNILMQNIKKWEQERLIIPNLPELNDYDPSEKTNKPLLLNLDFGNGKFMDVIARNDAIQVQLPKQILILRTDVLPSNLHEIFKDKNKYDSFKRQIDNLSKAKFVIPKPSPPLSNLYEYLHYDTIYGSPNVKCLAKERKRIYGILFKLEQELRICQSEKGFVSDHSFDTATPEEIEKAIDDGRIKPFKRVLRSTVIKPED